MRKFLQKLLGRTECVLATGHSFLFVTNFEKKKYKELFDVANAAVIRFVFSEGWKAHKNYIDVCYGDDGK